MNHHISCHISKDYQIIAKDDEGHSIIMDLKEQAGGKNSGFLPMPVMLASLGGCLSVDVKIILEKMHFIVREVSMDILAELDTKTTPKTYKEILISLTVDSNAPLSSIEKALNLAETTYCNVSAMLQKITTIRTHINKKESEK